MTETTMPAAEVLAASAHNDERASYECAFHVLPTVAEGEVPEVFEKLKGFITHAGGECFGEEMPERVDLAYEIVKSIESKNRKFGSAYFGWIRFTFEPSKIEHLTEEIEAVPQILRYLLIKLTKLEEEHPVKFHENRKSVKMVEIVDEEAPIAETHTEAEERVEVSEEALEESLDKITSDEETKEEAK